MPNTTPAIQDKLESILKNMFAYINNGVMRYVNKHQLQTSRTTLFSVTQALLEKRPAVEILGERIGEKFILNQTVYERNWKFIESLVVINVEDGKKKINSSDTDLERAMGSMPEYFIPAYRDTNNTNGNHSENFSAKMQFIISVLLVTYQIHTVCTDSQREIILKALAQKFCAPELLEFSELLVYLDQTESREILEVLKLVTSAEEIRNALSYIGTAVNTVMLFTGIGLSLMNRAETNKHSLSLFIQSVFAFNSALVVGLFLTAPSSKEEEKVVYRPSSN